MSRTGPTLVLFDIDGTLILSGKAGLRGLAGAVRQLYGVTDALDHVPVAGRTDRAIVGDVLTGLGRTADPDEIDRLRATYLDQLQMEIVKPVPDKSGVLPGVHGLLDAIDAREDLRAGLLTGNFEQGARIKLEHFALWHRFPFGAFGDDHVDRRALVPVALARAQAAGYAAASAADAVIIGDTPLDVDCAIAHGARVIGVTTGHYGRAELEAAGAGLVVGSLEEIDTLLRWI
jgi:phosphoglycolate phosphatase-like HAD superfamily hydrolase